jgi:hypothetical protein
MKKVQLKFTFTQTTTTLPIPKPPTHKSPKTRELTQKLIAINKKKGDRYKRHKN